MCIAGTVYTGFTGYWNDLAFALLNLNTERKKYNVT